MALTKSVAGARALVRLMDPVNGTFRTVGIFNNVSFDVGLDVQPIYILGRYSAAELTYTSFAPVSVRASAWRAMDHGPHADANQPHLQDLLNHEYIQMDVFDRGTNKRIALIKEVRPTGYSTSISARSIAEMTVTFVGLLISDESGDNVESPGAANLNG